MGSTNPEVVLDIFDRALQTPPEARDRFIAEACAGDDALRAEVASLLAHDGAAAASFMQPEGGLTLAPGELLADFSQLAASHDVTDPHAPDPLVGQRFGRYTIRRVIGHGGMGVVYEAQQERPNRVVALKVMRIAFAGAAALRRFEREAELLGRLQHPGIAQVYEADVAMHGTVRLPYFAMELVRDARTITDYAARAGLSLRERLELFARVCDAVQHAHQLGVIHRDLKPGNTLVGSDSAPKVIDFGVARVLNRESTLATAHAGAGQLVGTVHYMSPEQFEGDPARVDTRSDVYSLGVVLYELLAGRRPHVVEDSSMAGATAFARLVRDEPPPPPSRFNRQIRRSLEAVMLKAVARHVGDRYASAGELARDVRRFLAGEPTEAQPPTIAARVVRWMIRRPVVVTAMLSVAVAGAIVGGTVMSLLYLQSQPATLAELRTPVDWRVTVYSRAGTRLREFFRRSMADLPIVERVARPARWGGGHVLIGCDEPPGFGTDSFGIPLTAWRWEGQCDEIAWTGQLKPDDIPDLLRARTDYVFTPERFAVSAVLVADVFPESLDLSCEGDEIVTWHQHGQTHAAIRVYNIEGDVLYQVWLEMSVYDVCWVQPSNIATGRRAPGFLIVSGLHGYRTIHEITGENVSQHPSAIVALQPHLDLVCAEYLAPDAIDDRRRPLWVKFINATDGKRPEQVWLRAPEAEETRENACVRVNLIFPAVDALIAAGPTLLVDPTGRVLRSVRPGTALEDRMKLPNDHPAKIYPAGTYTLDDRVLPVRRTTTRPRDSARSPSDAGGG